MTDTATTTTGGLNTAIGAIARDLRQSLGLSIEKVGADAGMAASNLSQLERGVARWNADTIEKVSAALDVHPRDLMPHREERSRLWVRRSEVAHALEMVRRKLT